MFLDEKLVERGSPTLWSDRENNLYLRAVEVKQEYKLTEKQGFVALEILNPNQMCYRSEKKYWALQWSMFILWHSKQNYMNS